MSSLPLTEPKIPSARPKSPAGRSAAHSSLFVSLWAVYLLTLRQHLHGKRWTVIAGMGVLCAGLAILVRATSRDVPVALLEFLFVFLLIPQALVPLLALLYASGIVRDEQEEQTLTYLLIRPIPKWALYTVKLLATLTTSVVFTALLVVVTEAAIYTGAETDVAHIPLRCLQAASIQSLAVVAYCCLFGLISLLTNRVLIVGVLYTVIFEGLFANMPFSIRLATVIYYARIIAIRTMEFLVAPPGGGRKANIAAEAWQLDIASDPALTEHPSLRACILVLAVASAAFVFLAAILFSVREFHVKTPEKA